MASNSNNDEKSNLSAITRRNVLKGGVGVVVVGATSSVLAAMTQRLAKICRHVISLRNFSATNVAYAVRVSAFSDSTKIVSASVPTNWVQMTSYPTSVLWRLASNGVIPLGDPLPGTFSIDIQTNTQIGKRVLVEWLSKDNKVLCKQILRVPCGEPDIELVALPGQELVSCGCLVAETDADPDSQEYADPDLSVEFGTPVSAGFLKVIVPYTLEVEPASLKFTRKWEVTVTDEMGDEQPIVLPVTDNLTNQATFTLPEAGEYNFYLTVMDPATCVSQQYRDPEELYDVDFTNYKVNETPTLIDIKGNIDLCDPRKYEFRDVTDPKGNEPEWSVKNANGDIIANNLLVVSGVVSYSFPSLGSTYEVCLKAKDPSTGLWRAEVCKKETPTVKKPEAEFTPSYDSCVTSNFVVTFNNKSSTGSCPVTWDWDFGDGTPHSKDPSPTHTYVNPGTYPVVLTMTDSTTEMKYGFPKSITVEHWEPDIKATVCSDGTVIYETSAECNRDKFFCQRKWDFPEGDWHPIWKHRGKVKVCYEKPGIYSATLYAKNVKGGYCTGTKRVNVTKIERLCPHDKVKKDTFFSYDGSDYRLLTVFKYHGRIDLGRAQAKAKLFRKNSKGKFRRHKASSIMVAINGNVFRKDSTGCFTLNQSVGESKMKYNKAKIKKWWHAPLAQPFFRVKQNGLTSTYTVQVNSIHPGYKQTLNLWEHDCHCG